MCDILLIILGESTRPGANDINPEIEYERIAPLLDKIKSNDRLKHLLISLDTRKVHNLFVMNG